MKLTEKQRSEIWVRVCSERMSRLGATKCRVTLTADEVAAVNSAIAAIESFPDPQPRRPADFEQIRAECFRHAAETLESCGWENVALALRHGEVVGMAQPVRASIEFALDYIRDRQSSSDATLKEVQEVLREIESVAGEVTSLEVYSHNTVYALHSSEDIDSLAGPIDNCLSDLKAYRDSLKAKTPPTAEQAAEAWRMLLVHSGKRQLQQVQIDGENPMAILVSTPTSRR